jgi:hypothetical protein
MTRINQAHSKHQSPRITEFVIDSIDAYDMAYEVTSDLSAIFELLNKLTLAGHCNERIARMLCHAGFQHASTMLKLIDKKLVEANNALEELKEMEQSGGVT